MRVYFAGGPEALQQLREGVPVRLPAFVPVSDDEMDEFDALIEASEHGDMVIAADVDGPDSLVVIDRVASFHLDLDGSGDLAWFAPQEMEHVISLLRDGA